MVSGLSPEVSPVSVAVPPEATTGENEIAPSPAPGSSDSSVLAISVGSLLVGLVVASFSSF